MRTEDIEYFDGDTRLIGYLATDESGSGRRPAVLVIHEAWGLGEHAKKKAQDLAAAGYVAFAADMFGDRQQISELQPALDKIGGILGDREVLKARAGAALRALVARPDVDPQRIAAIGFCFGGRVVLELARAGVSLAAVASFHGDLGTDSPAKAGRVKAKVLVCTGADDPLIGPDQVQGFEREMRDAGADWQLNKYGGAVHGFTNVHARTDLIPGAIAYHAPTDKRSWQELERLLDETFAD